MPIDNRICANVIAFLIRYYINYLLLFAPSHRLIMRKLLALLLLTYALILHADTPDNDYNAGLEQLSAGDYIAAQRSFGIAAKRGNTDAQYQLGIIYLEGLGVNKSPEDAAYWFRKAAQNGHAASQFEIGCCFETGTGVLEDQRIAAEWLWRAADQGDADAALHLARHYRDGIGKPRDIEKARRYYKQAQQGGITEAEAELNRLPPSKAPQKKTAAKRSKTHTRKAPATTRH